MIEFTIPGEPQGKGRPRFTKRGFCYTPKQTIDYENLVQIAFLQAAKGAAVPFMGPVDLKLVAYYKIPKSASKKVRQDMLDNKIRPTKRVDIDNIIKIITDALNGIAYKDDAQIVSVIAAKYYSDEPGVRVWLWGLEGIE